MLKKFVLIWLLTNPLIGQSVEDPLTYPIFYFDLESFGIHYRVGTQVVNLSPGTSIYTISQEQTIELDMIVWIDGREDRVYYIHNTEIKDTWYEIIPLCLEPYIITFHLMTREHGLRNHYFVYAGNKKEEKLVYTFYEVDEANIMNSMIGSQRCVLWSSY
jgi:L-rhamnose mutarotase